MFQKVCTIFTFFLSLVITNTLGLKASLMDIHHNTSLRPILKDDSISFVSRAHICFCSDKEPTRLWLIAWPSICSIYIAHFIFTLAMHFCFDLIQSLTISLIMCECEYGLNVFDTHLAHCLFGGQQIATHDAIIDVMYTFTQKWACCMEKMVVHPYVKSFIMTRFLHDSWGPSLCCQCGGQWLNTRDGDYKCH